MGPSAELEAACRQARETILDFGTWIEAEVLGQLVCALATLDGIEDVGGKDGAFEADGGVEHAE
jgi:hypothetical protein